MIVFKYYSILMVVIFILSLRKLHATPPIPQEIQQKIHNCVVRIYNAFGGGDTREHGKVAIDHFVHILALSEYQSEACQNTISNEMDSGDLLGYYLSFKEHLDVGEIPSYPTFCEEVISDFRLKIDEDDCIDILKFHFENDRYKDLIQIFYEKKKNKINPKLLSKTIDYVEDSPYITISDGKIVFEYHTFGEVLTRKTNGEVDLQDRDGNVFTIPPPNVLTLKPNNETVIKRVNGQSFTFPRAYANFDLEEEDPPNTVNIVTLYIERVKETYGLDIDAMPPPQKFCENKYNPTQ